MDSRSWRSGGGGERGGSSRGGWDSAPAASGGSGGYGGAASRSLGGGGGWAAEAPRPSRKGDGKSAEGAGRDPDYDRSGFVGRSKPDTWDSAPPAGGGSGGKGGAASPGWSKPDSWAPAPPAGGGSGGYGGAASRGPATVGGAGGAVGASPWRPGLSSANGSGGGGRDGAGAGGDRDRGSRADAAGSWRDRAADEDTGGCGGGRPTAFGASALGQSWRDSQPPAAPERGTYGGGGAGGGSGGRWGGDDVRDRDRGKGDRGGKGGKVGSAQGKAGGSEWDADFDRGYPSIGKSGSKKGGKNGKDDWDPDYDRGLSKGSKGSKGKSKEGPKGDRDSDDERDQWKGGKKGDKGGDKGGKHGRGRKGAVDSDDELDRGKGGKGGKIGKGGKAGKGGRKGGEDDSGEESDESPPVKGSKGRSKGGGKSSGPPVDQEPAPPVGQRSGGSGAVTGKHLSDKRFQDLEIAPQTKRAFAEGFGYDLMTNVQAATIGPMLQGRDVVARAKTGTGKTLAFLTPIVEHLYKWPSGVGGKITAMILSPTRELASQIATEAEVLLRFHSRLGVACFYGGVNIKGDHRLLASKPIDILVATPGRLQDHLDNTEGFRARCASLSFLCMDEADQLLDMGFRDSILKILRCLPPPERRQGALFSATFPKAVHDIGKLALKADNEYIDTVRPDEEVTPDQIDQSVCITDMEGMTELLWQVVHSEMKRLPKDYKIMAFFCTARQTQLYSELFQASKVNVLEIHSRKSQAHRNRCADEFRKSHTGIIFSSDVSARGLDYPDVSTVIQVGIPSARDQYIHRLGRTGRAGKAGRCILLLNDFEEFFLKSVKDLPVKKLNAKTAFAGAPTPPNSLWYPKEPRTCGQAYQAWLGYYNSVKGLPWSKEQLVQEATRFAASIGGVGEDGLPPPILKKTVGMMGLKGVYGLNIVAHLPYGD